MLAEKCCSSRGGYTSTASAQEIAVLGHFSPWARERGKDPQSVEMLPKDQLKMTVKNRQFCYFCERLRMQIHNQQIPSSPGLSVVVCLHVSAVEAGFSISNICNVAGALEEWSLVTDGGKLHQTGSLCCSVCELLIQKLLSCLLATALENMTIPGVAEEPVYRYNP